MTLIQNDSTAGFVPAALCVIRNPSFPWGNATLDVRPPAYHKSIKAKKRRIMFRVRQKLPKTANNEEGDVKNPQISNHSVNIE